MELINGSTRKAIKKMVHVSQCARVLSVIPTPEDFALRLIGDMIIIARKVNLISIRINEILDRYASIPSEFLLEGFEEILDSLNGVNDYTKSAIDGTYTIVSSNVKNSKRASDGLDYVMATTPATATLQIGGGLKYETIALGSNLKLVMTGNDKRDVVPYIEDWVGDNASSLNKSIDGVYESGANGINSALNWIDNRNYDNTLTGGDLMDRVERTKKEVEYKIDRVRESFKKFTKDFEDMFGFVKGSKYENNAYNTNKNIDVDEAFSDATDELKAAAKKFVNEFNIGRVVGAIGGIVVGAGAATLAVDLLPSIDTDRILKDVAGGVDTRRIEQMMGSQYNTYLENGTGLISISDSHWKLSKDDFEKYDSEKYDKYLEEFDEENDKERAVILDKMLKSRNCSELNSINKSTTEKKSALNSIQNIRKTAVKAKQIENYKHFLSIELDCLKKDCLYMKNNIKTEWDLMMSQYKAAVNEITKFFTVGGFGGNETVDRCCDRINDDATQIVELCKSIAIELTNAICMVGVPYAVGLCSDMPVHKVLAFTKDLQMILTFLKNLIRLGIDIIAQLTILAKLIFNGFQNLADLLKELKKLIGVDKVLDMIDNVTGQLRPTMAEGKILMENSLTPIYYNETDDYERRVEDIEALLGDDVEGGYVEKFKYTDDENARKKYRNKVFGGYFSEDGIEDMLEELEDKGEREIVAYRSPILNDSGDDFVGWIFYHADAYDDMKKTWSSGKKLKRNKVIKKASEKNKLRGGRLIGGVAELRRNKSFGYYNANGQYRGNTVTGFDAYYWYTKYTNDPTDCDPDFDNVEYIQDKNGNLTINENFKSSVVVPIQTTANGSLVELSDGQRVFVEGKIVKSGDFVNVNGTKYRVK